MNPVALDAMGGDHAPGATVLGAAQAARNLGIPVLLVGDEARLKAELDRAIRPSPSTSARLEIVHAGDTIGMEESPSSALLRKRDASVVVAMNLVKEGRACGVVSAGNSGAVMGAAVLRLGLLPDVNRPAIAMLLPSRKGSVVVLDGGATVDPPPEHLRDFALMGSIYAHCLLHLAQPRVGLLSIGEEASKGSALTKKTYALLEQSPINFVGNVEGKGVAEGEVDVAVCDGFVGNVLLKSVEGYAQLFFEMMKTLISGRLRFRLGAWLLKPALRTLGRQFDYASYGGALLVGVNGNCVIAHGRSSPTAIENAIRVASELAEQRVVEHLTTLFHEITSTPLATAARHSGR